MASSVTIVASVLGSLLATIIVIQITLVVFVVTCCSVETSKLEPEVKIVYVGWKKKKEIDLESMKEKPQEEVNKLEEKKEIDLESMKEKPQEEITKLKDHDLTKSSHDSLKSWSKCSRLELQDFEKLTKGLASYSLPDEHDEQRMTSIQYKRNSKDIYHTFVVEPSESEKRHLSNQYDSFSQTLILQNLIQQSLNNDHVIRQVKDPFLTQSISVGAIVVVVKPFHGTSDHEFTKLETGDLLRVVKFYIQGNPEISRTHRIVKVKSEQNMSDMDPNYPKVYCTGVKLSSHLEYKNDRFALKTKDDNEENELLKDFPLKCVSLETTLIEQKKWRNTWC